ncbi:uncharacterized protein [Centruroides vittatus]|uniref:uncharacterized protein n=1 Tax=Centruroides vittatus TaxID=120091 RepID=UPI00351015D1
MNNCSIKIEKCIKYLGVWLDFRLSWDEHIKYLTNRTSLIFQAFSELARKRWGLSSQAISIIYDQIYIPIITYGCSSWGNAATKVHLRRKLLSSQRKALLLITRAYRTAPTRSLQVISRKPPITEIIEMEYNLSHLKLGTDICTHSFSFSSSNYEHLSPIASSLPPNINNIFSIVPSGYSDLEVYTDGSGIDNSTGCAFVAYANNVEIYSQKGKLDKNCTVFQAELLAIYMAIHWIEQSYSYINVHIISDSFSAIQLLYNKQLHPIATTIRNVIYTSCNAFTITWTRGHQGTTGNERADQLAKEAAMDETSEIVYNKISRRGIKKLLYRDLLHRWQQDWEHKHNATTFNFIPNIKDYHDKFKWVIPNSSLTQFLTGHGKFSAYLQRFTNKANTLCAICNQPDDVDHYLFNCISLEADRLALKILANKHNLPWPCKHEDLIRNKNIFFAFSQLVKHHETIAIHATME